MMKVRFPGKYGMIETISKQLKMHLKFNFNKENGLKLLFLGAHCDDIEIGCGGTILKMASQYEISEVKWVVFASNEERKKEAIIGANKFLAKVQNKEIIILDYKDAFLSQFSFEIKDFFESLKKNFDPDVTFTHFRDDRHQDHRLISELTWNTFRDHLVLEYEIPKYDGDLGHPNCFFKLTDSEAKEKVHYIINSYKSQSQKHWFDSETFLAIMRIRGLESGSITKYSEAFYARKFVF